MGRSVSTPMANTTQSMTRCDNLQARCPARPVSNRACSITAGEITLLRPASRSTTVSASGVGSKQLPCRAIIIASLKPGSYTHPRLQEAATCAKTNGIGAKNADYRGGVTCLYDTQLLGAWLHVSESGGRSRPEAVRGMPDVPIAPPATGPPEGWAAVGFVGPASFNRGLWARLLRVLGSERVRIWVVDRF